jgi:hypothetical protein
MGGYDSLQDMTERLDAFVKERDWNQFHSIKISLRQSALKQQN